MTLGTGTRGVVSNALYTGWSALLALLTVPVLIRTIGLEAYGMIGLLLSAQALIFSLDLGLSAAINRFVARYTALGELPSARDLVASASPLYGCFALVAFLAVSGAAPWIAGRWLVVEQMPLDTVVRSIILIGAIVAVRFWLTLYQSTLIGAGRVDISSVIGLVLISVAQLGGLVLAILVGDVQVYLVWLLVCAVAQWWLLRRYSWLVLAHGSKPRRGVASIARVYRFAAGMAGVSLTGMLLIQTDRIVLSRALPLQEFAGYALCWSLASGLYMIMTPAFNFIAPRFASAIALSNYTTFTQSYRDASRVFSALLIPAVVVGVLSAWELLFLFSGDAEVAAAMCTSLAFLLIGTAFNGIMHFPYALQLAHGRSNMALGINVALCAIFLPLLFTLIGAFGAPGAAFAWLLVNGAYMVIGLTLTHRYLEGAPAIGAWLTRDILPGLLVSIAVLLPVSALLSQIPVSPLAYVTLMGIATLLCSALALRWCAGLTVADIRGWEGLETVSGDEG